MQKILDLLVKAGCKSELVDAIGEALEEYKTTVNEQFEADYTAKVEQAKKVCVEETEAHKRELARRLQIFLETKDAAINAHLARQSAIGESEALSKLRNVKSLLEGVEVNGQSNNGQVTAALENAKRQIKQLTEERDRAITVANRQNSIAESVLGRNRQLVKENARLKASSGKTVRQVTEGRTRIDGTRRTQQSTTTRSTIVENQTRRPPVDAQPANVKTNTPGFRVADIAEIMDDDLI